MASAAGMAQADPKTEPQRNPALLAMARGRDCLILAPGVTLHDRATVVACHSNLSIHGKGGARKADDHYSVWGCAECHRWLDQGSASAAEKEDVFLDAMLSQICCWEGVTENMLEERRTREAAQWALDRHASHRDFFDSAGHAGKTSPAPEAITDGDKFLFGDVQSAVGRLE